MANNIELPKIHHVRTATIEFLAQESDSPLIPMITSTPHYISPATAEFLAQESDSDDALIPMMTPPVGLHDQIEHNSKEESAWLSLPIQHSITESLNQEENFYSSPHLASHNAPQAPHNFPTDGNAQEEDFYSSPHLASHNAPQAQHAFPTDEEVDVYNATVANALPGELEISMVPMAVTSTSF